MNNLGYQIKKSLNFFLPIITVIGATSAFWYFIQYDNIEKEYETRVKTQDVRINALNDERIRLELENGKLTSWLRESPNSIPYFEKSISEKDAIIDSLNKIIENFKSNNNQFVVIDDFTPKYRYSLKLKEGESFIDPLTKSTVSIYNISIDYKAFAIIDCPSMFNTVKVDKKPIEVYPGYTWDNIVYKNKNYKIVVKKIDPLFNEFVIEIIEL